MPLQSSGQISFEDIATEFGQSATNISLRSLSSLAGLGTPDSIEEFYGLSGQPDPPRSPSASESAGEITVVWTDPVTGNPDSYVLEVSVDGSLFTVLTNPVAISNDFTYFSLGSGSYVHRIKAVVGGVDSEYATAAALAV